jgi:hypothetical protein
MKIALELSVSHMYSWCKSQRVHRALGLGLGCRLTADAQLIDVQVNVDASHACVWECQTTVAANRTRPNFPLVPGR